MRYRNNINPLTYLSIHDVRRFEKFLNPSEDLNKRDIWKNEYDEAFRKYVMCGVNMPMYMKKDFTVLLMLHPLRPNEEKILFRLDDDGKVGYLNKFLLKKARSCKVPDAILDRYAIIKNRYKVNKKFSFGNADAHKQELSIFTNIILEICFAKNTRDGKLDSLLDD